MASLHYQKFPFQKLSNLHPALIHTITRQISKAALEAKFVWDIFSILVAMNYVYHADLQGWCNLV